MYAIMKRLCSFASAGLEYPLRVFKANIVCISSTSGCNVCRFGIVVSVLRSELECNVLFNIRFSN